MGSFIQRERALLRQLTSLVGERAHAEATLAEKTKSGEYDAQRAHDKEVKVADAEHQRETAAAAAELAERSGKIKAKSVEEVTAARKVMETQISAHNAKTNSLWNVAKSKWDEAMWLADTVVESGGAKIRNQYELSKRALTPKVQDVERIRKAAEELLQTHGHKPLPEVSPGDIVASVNDFNTARADAVLLLQTLQSRVHPALVQWPVIAIVSVVAAATIAGMVLDWSLPKVIVWNDVGVKAGAAAIGAAVLMIGLKVLLRKRVPAAAAKMATVLAIAKAQGDACLKAAEKMRDDEINALHARRDADLNKAKESMALARAEVDKRVQEQGPALKKEHEEKIAALERRFAAQQGAAEGEHKQRMVASNWRRDQSLQTSSNRRDRAVREVREEVDTELGQVEHRWKSGLDGVYRELDEIVASPEGVEPVWLRKGDYIAPMEVPAAIRFGRITVDAGSLPGGLSSKPQMKPERPMTFGLPAFLDMADKTSLLVQSGRDGREAAIGVLNTVMTRLLTTFPPGKVRFTIVDPIGLGRSFAGFMHLADHDPQLVADKIWTDPRHIEQKLNDLTEHMETVIQKYLRNEYATIQEYNQQAGEVAEPYRFLVMADFPVNLTENAAKKLWSIITSGARCGVYTLISESMDRQVPAYVPLADLERGSVRLVKRGDGFILQDEDFSSWPLKIDPPPDEDALTKLLNKVGALSKDATRVQVPFDTIAPQDGIWKGDSSEELRLPLGRAGAKKLQYFSLGRGTTQHALIAGRTGSGKSTLLHVLITNLALWYSPDEVEMYLVDFKKGVEFKTYATHHLPHARVIAVESEREFGLSVLKKLDAELSRRGALFRDAGAQDLAGYRKDGKIMPRVLLIVDEFQEFFVEDDKIGQEASLLLDRLVRQGRAFGMHVVLGSQTLGGAYSIARATIGQMAVRIALQCSESDSYLIMSEDNAAPRLLSRPGEAIYNDASGLVEGNSPFQIVWLPEAKREKCLNQATQELARTHRPTPPAAVVFEGNIPAKLADNALLARVITTGPEAGASPRVWLGDAISIKDPTVATFQRQTGSHMIIVGQQEESAQAIMVSGMLSLAAHGAGPSMTNGSARAHAARIMVLDGSPAEPGQKLMLEDLCAKLPGATYGSLRSAPKIVGEVYDLLQARTAADSTHGEPVYLIIYALHRFRDLRKSDDFSFGGGGGEEQAKTPSQQFAAILREGPALGIHVITWTDTVANVERALERSSLREFDSRVLFQMSATDSTHLIDSPAAANLGRHRALLYREQLGVPEKFRPYAMPDPVWLDSAIATISARTAHRPVPT